MTSGGCGVNGRSVLAEEKVRPSRRMARASAIFVTTQAPTAGEKNTGSSRRTRS
jgi:hypothetical protein